MAQSPLTEMPISIFNVINTPSSDAVQSRLGATANEVITQPTTLAKYVRLCALAPFYALFASSTAVATIAADTTDGTASELFPSNIEIWRYMGSNTSIAIISPSTANAITATFYRD